MSKSKRLPSRDWMRPTTGKTRESLMASLANELVGARVLDLFAGTGSLGLAALEAGASEAVFVEADNRSLKFLREEMNQEIARIGLDEKAIHIVNGRLPAVLERLNGNFDIILADPPYNSAEGLATLLAIESLLKDGGIAVFEHHHKENYPEQAGKLSLYKRRRFGETALSFWQKSRENEPTSEPV